MIDFCCFLGFEVVNIIKLCNKLKEPEEKDFQDFEILILPVNEAAREVNL